MKLDSPILAADSRYKRPAASEPSSATQARLWLVRSRVSNFGRYPRLMGVDAARGFAVLGMLGAHVGLGVAGFDWATPQTWADIVNGRSSILFAVIAGVSLALMTRGLDRSDTAAVKTARLRMVGRGVAVFAIGIALEMLGTHIAVILSIYGVLFILAAPLLTWRTRSLAIGAAITAVLAPVVLAAVSLLPSSVSSGPGVTFAVTGIYPIPVWIAFLLCGLTVGRMRLDTMRIQFGLLALGSCLALAGYGGAALMGSLAEAEAPASASVHAISSEPEPQAVRPASDFDLDGLYCQSDSSYIVCENGNIDTSLNTGDPDLDSWAGFWSSATLDKIGAHWLDASSHSGGALEIIGSGGFAMAVLALMLLAAQRLRWVLIPISALGSMPLTAYAAHVLLFVGTWFVPEDPYLKWAIGSAVLLLSTTAWAFLFGRGPLERLTARVANIFAGQQQLRRNRSQSESFEPKT